MTRFAAVAVVVHFLFVGHEGFAQEEGDYQIKNRRGEKLLAIEEGSKSAGAKVTLDTVKKAAGAKWKLVKAGDDFKIVNVNSGKVLTAPKLKAPSALVTIENDTGGMNQRWAFEKQAIKGGDYYVIKSRSADDLLLDVDNLSKDVQPFAIVNARGKAKDGFAQEWKLEPAK